MAREDGALGWKQTAIDCSLYANADESLGYKPQQDERRGMTVHGKRRSPASLAEAVVGPS
jgi:hypothetical protein